MYDKYELKEVIQNNVVTVTFEKVDGTERTMKCTLIPEYLPNNVDSNKQLLTENVRKENPGNLSVWDVENNSWRSFRYDSVKAVKLDLNM